jgi:hypothetical protein
MYIKSLLGASCGTIDDTRTLRSEGKMGTANNEI